MKFFTWPMMCLICSVFFLLNGCSSRHPQPLFPSPQPPPGICGGVTGWSCSSGQYCDFGLGKCQMSKTQGTCRPRPEMCTREYKPVCGCNDTTYSNACTAASAGISVKHLGRCEQEKMHRPAKNRKFY